jgi:ketosteroid isomerase-like protein
MFAAMLSLLLVAVQPGMPPPGPAAASASEDRRALEALNAAWLNAHVSHDVDVLGSILADDFVGIYGGGARRTKADVLARAADHSRQVLSVRFENLQIEIFGDLGVVSARSILTLRNATGAVVESRNDYADIYVRRAGRWWVVSAHVVPAPPAR